MVEGIVLNIVIAFCLYGAITRSVAKMLAYMHSRLDRIEERLGTLPEWSKINTPGYWERLKGL